MSTNSGPKRALILGGGGAVGVAWEIGLLAGLREGGIDAAAADVIVGTSAGSVVGSQIAHGRDPRDLLAAVRTEPPRQQAAGAERDTDAAAKAFGTRAAADEMTPECCAEVGAAALRARTASEADYLAVFEAQNLADWPLKPLLITAVDCESGELRVLDAASAVPLPRAISASCAVPALFPAVTIDRRRYMDGGVRSGTSADLALPYAPAAVLILAPLGSSDRGIHRICRQQAEAEARQLEAAGAQVRVIHMDHAAVAAGGANLMDSAARVPAAEAGYAHGLRIADDLQPMWISGATASTTAS
jgi:NTE family protein